MTDTTFIMPVILDKSVAFISLKAIALANRLEKVSLIFILLGIIHQIPESFLKGRNKDDFFVLKVKGDSMYPEYRNGDKILILKQNAIDYNGQIAVAIYNDELGTLKKIEYKKDSVNLVPINNLGIPKICIFSISSPLISFG